MYPAKVIGPPAKYDFYKINMAENIQIQKYNSGRPETGQLAIVPVKSQRPPDPDATVLAYWLLYCRAPGRSTAPGETVDLGEIGEDRPKDWERLTPYSLARQAK